jgi:hypothetical protein
MQVSVAEIRVTDDRIGPSHLALIAVDLDDVFKFELEFLKLAFSEVNAETLLSSR